MRNFTLVVSFLMGMVFISTNGQAEDTPNTTEISAAIEKIIAAAPDHANIAVLVQSMQTGQVIYERNADRYYTPASTQKLFTATAALLYLGNEFRYQTILSSDQKFPKKGLLTSNLYLRFEGDPTLKTADLENLLQTLKNSGVKKIKGNIYLNNNEFKGKPYGQGWMWDDFQDCFSAPLSALMLNHNCFDVKLSGGKKIGEKPKITAIDDLTFTPIVNKTSTQNPVPIYQPDYCPLEVDINDQNTYQLSGCIPPKKETVLSFAIAHPELYVANTVKYLLKKQGIQLIGQILINEQNNEGKYIIDRHASEPLPQLISVMLHKSDNLLANSLFKTMGARYYASRGDWHNGSEALQVILQDKAGLDLSGSIMLDGAGLPRYNLIRPRDYAQLLKFNFNNSAIGTNFLNALPIWGVDTSLLRPGFVNHPILLKNVHAKTGTMKGVLSLAGYMQTQKNDIYSFVIMINNFPGKFYPYYFLETDILEYFVKNL